MKPHERIRAYRKAHNIPAEVLAKKLGIATSTLRSLENGTRNVTPDLAPKIEDVTSIPRSEFFPKLFAGMAA